MNNIKKLQNKLAEIQSEIVIEKENMALGTLYPIIWCSLHREEAEVKKAIELAEKNKTPLYRFIQKRNEYLEIKLAGALKAEAVEHEITRMSGVRFPIVLTSLSREIIKLKQKLSLA